MSTETEVVRVGDLAVGDLVLRVVETGLAWFEVAAVETEVPGGVVRVEFSGEAACRYLPGSTFARRIEDAA